MAHVFNSSSGEAEEGRSVNLRPAIYSRVLGEPCRRSQKNKWMNGNPSLENYLVDSYEQRLPHSVLSLFLIIHFLHNSFVALVIISLAHHLHFLIWLRTNNGSYTYKCKHIWPTECRLFLHTHLHFMYIGVSLLVCLCESLRSSSYSCELPCEY